jgi:SAM-dependent methyltransferase
MRPEVYKWVASTAKELKPKAPVLEVGARNVNGSVRDLFPEDYTGLDAADGDGVDLVGDILDEPRPELAGSFRTIVCCETLEHVTDPRVALQRMFQYLTPSGGLLIATWCFNFPIHSEPDYWRATPEGFRLLLEAAGFADIDVSTEGEGPVGVFATARRKG